MSKARNGEGSIRKVTKANGRIVWDVEISLPPWPEGTRRRTRRTFATLDAAKKGRVRMLAERDDGRLTTIRPDTVLTYGLDWARNVKALTVRPSTAADYEYRLRLYIAPHLGHLRLTDLTAPHVDAWLATLRRAGKSAQTINGARQVLYALCKHAQRTGVIPSNPVAATDPVKRRPGDASRLRGAWSRDEAAAVIRAAVLDDALDVFLHLMVYLGLRPGEAMGLRWCDVDLDAGSLDITGTQKQERRILPNGTGVVRPTRNPPKTAGSWRRLNIEPALGAALVRQQMRQAVARLTSGATWQETDYVVTSTVGTPVATSNLRRRYEAFLKAAGLRYIRLHDIRHTAASLALNDADLPIEKVSQALGHTRIDTTKQIYARSLPRYNQAFGEALASVLPAPPAVAAAPTPAQARPEGDDHA